MIEKSKTQHFHPLCIVWAKEAVVMRDGKELKLVLNGLESKILYSASRPKKYRNFILSERFMTLWSDNKDAFEEEPPEIGIVYSKMNIGADGIAHAVPIKLSDPICNGNDWKFKLEETSILKEGCYNDIALFIDWLPSIDCPLPIKIIFPED